MKIFLKISITIALLLCVVSCGSKNNTSPISSEDESSSALASVSEKPQNPSHIDYFSPTMENYEEYLSGIALFDLPQSFVYYDSVRQFGDFHSFVYLSNIQSGDYSHYMYTFIDESGYETTLYIEEFSDETVSAENIVMNVASDDLRTIDEKSQMNSVYYVGELKYNYVYGNLLSVEWVQNGLEFTLYAEPLHQYPSDADTLMGKILNATLAPEAYEEQIVVITEEKE